MGWVHRLAAASLAALAILTPLAASAQIGAFNTAIQTRDYQAAAAAAKQAWPDFDRTSPDTALIAREFGFASYMAGDFEAARDYGRFLVEEGGALPTPDDQPATSLVLLRAAEFRLGSTEATRSNLAKALAVRLDADNVDAISIFAAEAYYTDEWTRADWAAARSAGEVAAQLLQRAGDAYAPRQASARVLAAAAAFMRSQSAETYTRMADAHDGIVDQIDQTPNKQRRDALVALKFQAEAWFEAIGAYFGTVQQTGSNIPQGVRTRRLKQPSTVLFDGVDPPGACIGRVNARDIRYPGSAEFRGFNGAVIVRLNFDEQGRVTEHEILGAVPARAFAADVERQAPNFRLLRHSADPANCSLAKQNHVLRIVFRML